MTTQRECCDAVASPDGNPGGPELVVRILGIGRRLEKGDPCSLRS